MQMMKHSFKTEKKNDKPKNRQCKCSLVRIKLGENMGFKSGFLTLRFVWNDVIRPPTATMCLSNSMKYCSINSVLSRRFRAPPGPNKKKDEILSSIFCCFFWGVWFAEFHMLPWYLPCGYKFKLTTLLIEKEQARKYETLIHTKYCDVYDTRCTGNSYYKEKKKLIPYISRGGNTMVLIHLH